MNNLEAHNTNDRSFVSKLGMVVYRDDSIWELSPIKCKGWKIDLNWLYSDTLPSYDREIILNVLENYSKTKSVSTVSSINTNIKPFFSNGIIELTRLEQIWSSLKVNHKKGLNQFFATCKKLDYKQFIPYHSWTKCRLPKTSNKNIYSASKGGLTELEYNSLINEINLNVQTALENQNINNANGFSIKTFTALRNALAAKLLVSIVRRPFQLVQMKWCDLLPIGQRFDDKTNNIESIGQNSLQLRVFRIKQSGGTDSFRYDAERDSIYIHEIMSEQLILYRKVYFDGFKLVLKKSRIDIPDNILDLFYNLAIFPDISLFKKDFSSLKEISALCVDDTLFSHIGEQTITNLLPKLKVNSDRTNKCIVTNNRLRHTILTRGAEDGLSGPQLAKITGVTVPAVRSYIDMNFETRRLIDEKYIGNSFLDKAFNKPTEKARNECILDGHFNPVGNLSNANHCSGCNKKMGKPIGCYGCHNFTAILEADHQAVLDVAACKLKINLTSYSTPLNTRFIKQLSEQIKWIKYTIHVCDEMIKSKRSIND